MFPLNAVIFLKIKFAIREAVGNRGSGTPVTPDCRLYAGHQLTRAERLGDIVIGAQLKQQHFVDDLGYRAEYDDRGLI